MSPAQHQPPSYATDNQVASSNSTANRFLGASRKSWMARPWAIHTPPALLTPSNPKKLASPKSKTNVATIPSPRQEKPADAVQHSRPSLQAVTSSTQFSPVSPLTPNTVQPDPVSDADKRCLQAITIETRVLESASATTFPTPEPSNTSHTSPVAVTEGAHPVSDLPDKDAPITEGTPAASLPTAEAQSFQGEGAMPRVPAMGTFNTNTNIRTEPKPHQPSQSQSKFASSAASDGYLVWTTARNKLRSFLATSTKLRTLSETVELPRVRILQDVCAVGDMFYLALHQTFCLNSSSPSRLKQVLKYGIRPDFGFDVVAQLLVDNKRLSSHFVKWSVDYPLSLEAMLKINDYTHALTQVANCLEKISRTWPIFEKDLRARGYPPQVDELVIMLGVVSPVFQTVVFTAVSRRLFGHREELFKACMSLFEDDQRTYKERSALSEPARQRAMFAYFEKYRQLCTFHSVPPGSNVLRDNAGPAGRALSSDQLPTTASFNTLSGPPPIQQTANSTHRPLLNPIDSYSLPSSFPPNYLSKHHTSPNMTGNTNPQQQQPSYRQTPIQTPQSTQHVQTRQQYALPSRPPVPFPPPPPHHIIASQGNSSGTITTPNQMLPPNFEPRQYPPPHVRRVSNGALAPGSMGAAHNLHHSSLPEAQPPPHNAQGQQPMYPQNVPQPGTVHAIPSMTMSMRPPSGHHPPQPAHSIPSTLPTQPSGTTPTALPSLSPIQHQATPPSSLTPPSRHSSVAERSPEIIQYFSEFAVPAQRLPSNRSAFSWKFTVSREMLRRRSRLVPQGNGRGYMPVLSDGDVSYRLRCVKSEGRIDLNSVTAWSQAESHWPEVVYIHVNNNEIYRAHNSKHVPLPINSHLKDGVNDIRLNILHTSEQRAKNTTYAIAIEVLHVRSPSSFQGLIKKLPAETSRKQIQNQLSSNNNDDDLVIMDDFISIDLRDPFTTQIFDVPVRGILCTHRECFDLSTFLQTLSAKPLAGKRAMYLRCPICKQDARPSLLLVDEFLAEVRATLSQQKRLKNTKTLRVKSNGSWEAVMELDSDTRTTSRKRDRKSFEADIGKNEEHPKAPASRTPASPEVIELD